MSQLHLGIHLPDFVPDLPKHTLTTIHTFVLGCSMPYILGHDPMAKLTVFTDDIVLHPVSQLFDATYLKYWPLASSRTLFTSATGIFSFRSNEYRPLTSCSMSNLLH